MKRLTKIKPNDYDRFFELLQKGIALEFISPQNLNSFDYLFSPEATNIVTNYCKNHPGQLQYLKDWKVDHVLSLGGFAENNQFFNVDLSNWKPKRSADFGSAFKNSAMNYRLDDWAKWIDLDEVKNKYLNDDNFEYAFYPRYGIKTSADFLDWTVSNKALIAAKENKNKLYNDLLNNSSYRKRLIMGIRKGFAPDRLINLVKSNDKNKTQKYLNLMKQSIC